MTHKKRGTSSTDADYLPLMKLLNIASTCDIQEKKPIRNRVKSKLYCSRGKVLFSSLHPKKSYLTILQFPHAFSALLLIAVRLALRRSNVVGVTANALDCCNWRAAIPSMPDNDLARSSGRSERAAMLDAMKNEVLYCGTHYVRTVSFFS